MYCSLTAWLLIDILHPVDRLDAARSKASTGAGSASSTASSKTGAGGGGVASSTAGPAVGSGGGGIDHRSAPSHHPHGEGATLGSVVYRCNQADCVKEFRSRDNLVTHLAQVNPSSFAITIKSICLGGWHTVDQQSRPLCSTYRLLLEGDLWRFVVYDRECFRRIHCR